MDYVASELSALGYTQAEINAMAGDGELPDTASYAAPATITEEDY